MKLVTTSWDDGHPLDFKLANMLVKYNLAATFYIPKNNPERLVMHEKHITQLSEYFEIGAHTLNHAVLSSKDKIECVKQIYGSFLWLEDLLGYEPFSFCFPSGKYDKELLNEVFESGYKLARTTELLCTTCHSTSQVVPTTLQFYEHSIFTYAKHLLKRKRVTSLIKFLVSNSPYNILKLVENYFTRTGDGEFFHLWGHSWEIEEYSLWNKLEDVLSLIANNTECVYVPNKKITEHYQYEMQAKIINSL